jgi:hypothetical protein
VLVQAWYRSTLPSGFDHLM